MFNLAYPLAKQETLRRRRAAAEFIIAAAVTFFAFYLWSLRFDTPHPTLPEAPVSRPLPEHPLERHIQVWDALAASLPTTVQLEGLEFSGDHWLVHLVTENPGTVVDWRSALVEETDIQLQIQQSKPLDTRVQFIYEARLP